MKSYLSLITVSAKVKKKQNRMTVLCITTAVFLVTAVFSMAESAARQETARLTAKHGASAVESLFASQAFISLLPLAAVLFFFVLCAGVLMIAGSLNSNVAQRTQLFGMLRCIGMSKRQVRRYVRLEALQRCVTAVPAGIAAGTVFAWILCAVLKYIVGGEWADMPQLRVSLLGVACGAANGFLTVLIAARRPAKTASRVTPVAALAGMHTNQAKGLRKSAVSGGRIERKLGIRHATESKKNLFLLAGSYALSIVLFMNFSVFIDLVNCLMPQSAAFAEIEIWAEEDAQVDACLPALLEREDCVERAFGRRALYGVPVQCTTDLGTESVTVVSYGAFDLGALRRDGMLRRGADEEAVLNGEGAYLITDAYVGKEDSVTVFGKTFRAAGKLKYDLFSEDGSTGGLTTLIVSDEAFAEMTGISDYTMVLVCLEDNVSDEDTEALRKTAEGFGKWNDFRDSDTRGTYAAFLVCAYGFLAVIGLVTVMNIVNSIAMSVNARIRQYGTMRAAGMTVKQVKDMVRAEALTYASSGSLSGIVLGLLSSGRLYGFLVTSHFPYAVWSFPWGELAVIAVFFVISAAAGVWGPIRRLERMSVTGAVGSV